MKRGKTCPQCGVPINVNQHGDSRVLACPSVLTCGWSSTQQIGSNGLWLSAGDMARDRGMERSAANAGEEWKQMAQECVRQMALQQQHICADQLRDYMEASNIPDPPKLSSYGHILPTAAKAGILEDTGRSRKSERKQSNSRRLIVWRSLLFRA